MTDLIADQVTQIGDDPVLAGLDEPVLVEPVDIALDDVDLFGDHLQKRAERKPQFGVALAMDNGQQVEEAVRGMFHALASVRISVSGKPGFRYAICAGRMRGAPPAPAGSIRAGSTTRR